MPTTEQYDVLDRKLHSAQQLMGEPRDDAMGRLLLLTRNYAYRTVVSWVEEFLEGSVFDALELLDEAVVRAWAGLKGLQATTGKKLGLLAFKWLAAKLPGDNGVRTRRGLGWLRPVSSYRRAFF